MNKILLTYLVFLALTISLAHASDNEKESFDDCIKKAMEALSDSNLDKAIEKYKKALEIKPDSDETHIALGKTYWLKWNNSFMQDQFNRSFKKSTTNEDYVINQPDFTDSIERHRTYGNQKLRELALNEYREALKLNPNNLLARYFIAADLKHSGLYDKAIKEAEINLKIDPKHTQSISLIALTYNLQGKHDEAIAKLKEAIDIEPDEYGHHYSLGKLYWEIGKKDEALKELEILKKLNIYSYELLRDFIYGVPLSRIINE